MKRKPFPVHPLVAQTIAKMMAPTKLGRNKRTGKRYVKGKPLRIPVGLQLKYVGSVDEMTDRMVADVNSRIATLFARHAHFFATTDAYDPDQARDAHGKWTNSGNIDKTTWKNGRLDLKPEYMYHSTTKENAERILKEGLVLPAGKTSFFAFSPTERYISGNKNAKDISGKIAPITHTLAIRTSDVTYTGVKYDKTDNDSIVKGEQFPHAFSYTPKETVKISPSDIRLHYVKYFATDAYIVGMDATDPSFASQLRILINRAKSKWDQLFGSLAMGLSPWMADAINRASSDSVRLSVAEMPNLREEGHKLTIDIKTLSHNTKEILRNAANHSADFIRSIPEQHLNKIADATYRSITEGKGIADLQPFLDKQGSQIKNWAHNTAMDQTRKTYNALNKGRMQKIGITKGEWIHSGGSLHPRELHEDFDGQTYNLSEGAPVGDDGNMVDPGEEPNCRCTFAPVVEFADDED